MFTGFSTAVTMPNWLSLKNRNQNYETYIGRTKKSIYFILQSVSFVL